MSASGKNEQILGNSYRLGNNIGEGTFGKVRLGVHILSQQKVAVKTLQKDKIVEQSDIERVTREICILKILRHPNIIQLYEIIETKTAIHLIMEYAEGGELFDYIVKNKRIEETQAAKFLQQILSGVEYIHKNGIVHRDLKPQNLLLDSNKNIKIVDFGLSNQYKPGERLKTACGSPCYAAPEMIAGKKYQCINVDIWSCGIIIYAMLCGYLPFEDANTNKLYKKIIAGDFQMPKFLSSQSRDILRNILNVNPETRYKIAQIRGSKWYNLCKSQHEAKGIVVGKDAMPIDNTVVKRMTKFDFDPVQTRTYVLNNRHNHITAMYYLLMKKMQKEPKVQQIEDQSNKNKQKKQKQISKQKQREASPLIYRPQKKPDFYIPGKKNNKQHTKDSSKNDSINASNIISSLVQANKGRLLTQRFARKPQGQNFDKQQDFKNFPRKLNSSIHQSDSGKKIPLNTLTSRSGVEEKSFDSKRSSYTGTQTKRIGSHNQSYSIEAQSSEPINKKRQQLSQQLKQISVKIDKQINQLKKQHDGGQNQYKRQSYNHYTSGNSTSTNRKKISQSFTNPSNERLRLSQNIRERESRQSYQANNIHPSTPTAYNQTARQKIMSQGNNYTNNYNNSHQIMPKSHIGPFNAKCLFLENAPSLMKKISNFLKQNNLRYIEQEPYTFKTLDNHSIWLESLSGGVGLHLVNFTKNFPRNDELLDVLAQ